MGLEDRASELQRRHERVLRARTALERRREASPPGLLCALRELRWESQTELARLRWRRIAQLFVAFPVTFDSESDAVGRIRGKCRMSDSAVWCSAHPLSAEVYGAPILDRAHCPCCIIGVPFYRLPYTEGRGDDNMHAVVLLPPPHNFDNKAAAEEPAGKLTAREVVMPAKACQSSRTPVGPPQQRHACTTWVYRFFLWPLPGPAIRRGVRPLHQRDGRNLAACWPLSHRQASRTRGPTSEVPRAKSRSQQHQSAGVCVFVRVRAALSTRCSDIWARSCSSTYTSSAQALTSVRPWQHRHRARPDPQCRDILREAYSCLGVARFAMVGGRESRAVPCAPVRPGAVIHTR